MKLFSVLQVNILQKRLSINVKLSIPAGIFVSFVSVSFNHCFYWPCMFTLGKSIQVFYFVESEKTIQFFHLFPQILRHKLSFQKYCLQFQLFLNFICSLPNLLLGFTICMLNAVVLMKSFNFQPYIVVLVLHFSLQQFIFVFYMCDNVGISKVLKE